MCELAPPPATRSTHQFLANTRHWSYQTQFSNTPAHTLNLFITTHVPGADVLCRISTDSPIRGWTGLWYAHTIYYSQRLFAGVVMVSVSQVGIRSEGANGSCIYRVLTGIDIVRRWATNIQTAPSPLDEEDSDPLLNLRKIYHYSCTTPYTAICLQKIDGFATEIHISDPPQSDQTKAAVAFRRNRKG